VGNQQATEVVASASVTADGNSGNIPILATDWRKTSGPRAQTELLLFLDVTVITGTTPTLDITLEWSLDGGTTFAAPAAAPAFAQVAGVIGTQVEVFSVLGTSYRLVYDLEGTSPDYTFSVRELVR